MKRAYTSLVIFVLFMASLCAMAVAMTDSSLYRAQLPIISAESQPSSDELKMALAQLLSRLTNIQNIDKDPAWADSLSHAQDWMLSYQYIPASNGSAFTLQIDFDPAAISRLLKSKGQNIPTAGPPQRFLAWLVIESGEQQQLLGSASPYAKTIDTSVKQSSIDIEWPLLDLTDLKTLSAAQAWGGDWPSIDAASKRYTHDGILLVHLSKGDGDTALWTSEWTLKTPQNSVDWAFSANDAASALRGGMGQLSSMMTQGVKPQAPLVPQAPLPVSPVEVVVYGIADLSALDGLKNNLQQLAPVQDIEVVEVSPDEVILTINAQGGSAALQQAIADQVLTLVKTQSADKNIPSDALIYQWAL
ncbi:MAG: hypothetical protein K0R48_173 [Gammaproteobacteria bacterium]|jgi:hypothetical protein|nr:hypothetical protein [Gammaproteobacteria bacterium]